MAVQVDVCGQGLPCSAAGRTEPARLWIADGSTADCHCPDDLLRRMWAVQQIGGTVAISDAAKAVLRDKATL
jgi:hypothetical protein